MIAIPLILFYTTFVSLPHRSQQGITSQWSECGCSWEPWEAWSDCDRECNGQRRRSRKVRLYTNKPGCVFAFTTCATSDMGWDYERCNTFCYNGGTSDGYSCTCVTGYYGSCCGFQVNCGDPGSIDNGVVGGTTYTYGAVVSYSCNTGYLLVEGSTIRTCQLNALWSGTKPRCAFFNSCGSSPCKNGATCTNIPDDYQCTCSSGWSGKNCDIDIQAPVMSNCSSDVDTNTNILTKDLTWQVPSFTDPHGFDVIVTSNYPTNSYIFPWGDFNVSHSAVKPNNGLSTECLFEITVRPNACTPLNVPKNGALICNNWRTDYGQFCIYYCAETYTVPRGVNPDIFYVCGATGSWTPSNTVPDCSVSNMQQRTMTGYTIARTYNGSTDSFDVMRQYYINKLKQSEFKYFCDKYSNECTENNVIIKCS